MTKNYGALFGGSSHPHGRGDQQKPQESMIQNGDTLEDKSTEQLIYLIKELRTRIKYLESEIVDWREGIL